MAVMVMRNILKSLYSLVLYSSYMAYDNSKTSGIKDRNILIFIYFSHKNKFTHKEYHHNHILKIQKELYIVKKEGYKSIFCIKQMGCKQTTQMRRHSYISSNNRPVDYLFEKNIVIDEMPDFVNEFIYRYNMHQLKYLKAEYKDLFFHDDHVYGIERISESEFIRRQTLQKRVKSINNVCMYKEMFYLDGITIGKMKKYEIDLFELLKTCLVDLDDFVWRLCTTLTDLHEAGIYVQDLKPENIFVDMKDNEFIYHIGDIEYSFLNYDFVDPSFVKKRTWIRTLNFCPNLGKPQTKLEAIRNDYYALAIIIGRIETFYIRKVKLNVFCEPREAIFEHWDDRDTLKYIQGLKYSEICSDFIVEKLFYKTHVKNFIPTLLSMSQQ